MDLKFITILKKKNLLISLFSVSNWSCAIKKIIDQKKKKKKIALISGIAGEMDLTLQNFC